MPWSKGEQACIWPGEARSDLWQTMEFAKYFTTDEVWPAEILDANPDYKGKWSAPKVDNPEYKGVWAPRQVANPNFFVDEKPYAMAPIGGIGWID